MRIFWKIVILSCFISCQEASFSTYETKNYVQFVSSLEDSTVVSFTFYPEQNEILWPLPVEISGIPVEQKLSYRIIVDKERTTAIEGTHFDLSADMDIKPWAVRDTCWLKLKRMPEMKTKEFRIVLRIIDSRELLQGQLDYSIAIIRVNDKITQPGWWDGNIVQFYLGEYSDKKFSLFIEVTGKADLSDVSKSELRMYSLQFKYWLQEQKEKGNTIKEDDGEEMTVRIRG